MKTLLKVGGSVLIGLVLLLLVLRITGLNPHERIPGLWITGKLVTTPVTDWSYTDKMKNDIKVQTRTWYLLPHSVTTGCVAYNSQLYLTTTYFKGEKYPHRRWHKNVARDPHVRLKIGDQLFDRTLLLVTDPVEKAGVLQARGKKIPTSHNSDPTKVIVFRIMPE